MDIKTINAQGRIGGHDYVDLDLPHGVLWATCNVGASRPEGYGNYYAWGETKTKNITYDWSTYKYANGSYHELTKYCCGDYGANRFFDGLTNLRRCDDPASVNWGAPWITPTKTQWDQLLFYTTRQWTTMNGVYGCLFTSMKNGQILFLPAAGYRIETIRDDVGYRGHYLSRSLYSQCSIDAWGLNFFEGQPQFLGFDPNSCVMFNIARCFGYSVRPVCYYIPQRQARPLHDCD